MATRTPKKRGRPAKKMSAAEPMMTEVIPARRTQAKPQLSENVMLGLAIFFLLFAVLAVMAYFKQVDDNRQLIEFRQRQDEMLLKAQPATSPSPTPKTKSR